MQPKHTIEKLQDFLRDISEYDDKQREEVLKLLPQAHSNVEENVIVEFIMCGIHNALIEFVPDDSQSKYRIKEPTDFIPE